MEAKLDSGASLTRARRIGRITGTVVALLTGAMLCLFALSNVWLIVSILGATVVVTAAARRIGALAGEQIAPRPFVTAIGIGALGGLAALVAAALTAGTVGFLWSLLDRAHGAGWLYSYVGKPFLAVLSYGLIVALLLGIIAGLIIRGLIGRAR